MTPARLDIAILGGGMAGSLLARQLARQLPERRIAVFERKTEYELNVGESMVEIASDYFVRRLGLSSYLFDRHYPKNGLRFFFDSPQHDVPLEEMSEIGSSALPLFPAFQIDRSRLESDLVAMNRQDGVLVDLETRVEKLELGGSDADHRVTVSDGTTTRSIACRWVIDATGRRQLISRLLGLRIPERRLRNASTWGWFEGVTDIDGFGPESFRKRVRHTPRRLSTLHFLYRGYWIWFIPLQNGLTSIGVVGEAPHYRPEHRSEADFLSFLRSHAAVASLLVDAKPLATQCFTQLAYGTRQFLSPDRWALVGEAAAFPDPFYSPGADFIALENDFVTDLIGRDLAGESRGDLEKRTTAYDEFLKFRFDAAMQLYLDQYSVFGSYELCKLKWDFDVACYYNLWISHYLHDQHLELREVRRQTRQRKPVLAALSNFAALFRQIDAHLSRDGQYHRMNRGAYSNGQDLLGFIQTLAAPRTHREVLRQTEEIFNAVRDRALDLLEGAARQRSPMPLLWFMRPRDLRDG